MANQSNTLRSQNNLDERRAELENWIEQHRSVFDLMLDAYCVVDLANRVIHFNVAFTELCGESHRKITKIGAFCDLLKTELCPSECPAIQVAQHGRAVRLDELKGSSKAFPQLEMIVGGIPIRNGKDEIIGSMLTIRNVTAESELQRKYQERKLESIHDGLTHLFNKVYTEDSLIREIKITTREKARQLSLLMCDIDHFKKVNDQHGHQAGDYVLSTVAQLVKAEARDTDMVGRFGGEEFMVILPATDGSGARVFAERLRKRVSSTKFVFEGRHIPVTISLGISSFKEKWRQGVEAETYGKQMISEADTALYYAKANGRNLSCHFDSLPGNSASADGKKAA